LNVTTILIGSTAGIATIEYFSRRQSSDSVERQ
jgi:hypothetical protein